jgi:hypothetical protein
MCVLYNVFGAGDVAAVFEVGLCHGLSWCVAPMLVGLLGKAMWIVVLASKNFCMMHQAQQQQARTTTTTKNNKMPYSMKINGAVVCKFEGRIGMIDEDFEDSDGITKTKIQLENFSGYILLDNNHVLLSGNGNQQQVGHTKPPPNVDQSATPIEWQLSAATSIAGGGGSGSGGGQQLGLPCTKPPHQSGLIGSFKEHHAKKVKVEPGNVVKVKEEQVIGHKTAPSTKIMNAVRPVVAPPKQQPGMVKKMEKKKRNQSGH